MGFLDRFKQKRSEFLNTRQVNVYYGFECSECSTVQWFYANLNVIDNEHYVYVLLRNNHTGELKPAKLPTSLIRLNEQEEEVVEGVHDKVGQDLIDLSRDRMQELLLNVQCEKCGAEFPYIIATAVITNEHGKIMFFEGTNIPEVYALPIVILGYKHEDSSFKLHSALEMPDSEQPEELQFPSMHIIPLDSHTKQPVIFYTEDKDTLPAITTNGRISFFPFENNLGKAILDKIEERYPPKRYSEVKCYVCVAVMLQPPQGGQALFIFDVWGFWEPMLELDHLYHMLLSLGGKTVGDEYWTALEKHLSSDPTKFWINDLIEFLKVELDWKNFIDSVIESWQ